MLPTLLDKPIVDWRLPNLVSAPPIGSLADKLVSSTTLAVNVPIIFSLAERVMLLVGSATRLVLLTAPVLVLSTNSLTLPVILTCAVATIVDATNNVAIAIFFI